MATLSERFQERMTAAADRGAPSSVRGTMDRYGWNTRDLAQRLGVSERTARRYARENRITAPGRTAAEARRGLFDRARADAARDRQRARMQTRGLASMSAQGEYMVSKNRYRTRPGASVRIGPNSGVQGTNRISPAAMRAYFAALNQGDEAAADQILNDALGAGYGAPTVFTDADSVDFTI